MLNTSGPFVQPKRTIKTSENNNPEQKTPKKRGCLKVFIVVLIFLMIAMYALVRVILPYLSELEKISLLVGELNKEFNIEDVITNEITEEDYNSFLNKVIISELNILQDGKINLENENLKIKQTQSFTDNEIGSLINKYIKDNSNDLAEILIVKQLTITENTLNNFTIKTIIEFNLSVLVSELTGELENLPNSIYITNEASATINNNNHLEVSEINIIFNNLSAEINNQLVSIMNTIFSSSLNNYKMTELPTEIIKEVLNLLLNKNHISVNINTGEIIIKSVS